MVTIPRYTVRQSLEWWEVLEDGRSIGILCESQTIARVVASDMSFKRKALAFFPRLVALVRETWERVN